jgi:hypothetical protein
MSKLKIEWCDVPMDALMLAARRTGDMVTHYGRNIRNLPIESLANSCYLQGVNDCLAYLEKPKLVDFITDFQI